MATTNYLMSFTERLRVAKELQGVPKKVKDRQYLPIQHFMPFCAPYFKLEEHELLAVPEAMANLIESVSGKSMLSTEIHATGMLLGEGTLATYHTYLAILRARAVWHKTVIERLSMRRVSDYYQISSAPLTLGVHLWTEVVGRAARAQGLPYMEAIPAIRAEYYYHLKNADGSFYMRTLPNSSRQERVVSCPRAEMYAKLLCELDTMHVSRDEYPV